MGNGERIEAEKLRRAEVQIKKRELLETENRRPGGRYEGRRAGGCEKAETDYEISVSRFQIKINGFAYISKANCIASRTCSNFSFDSLVISDPIFPLDTV